MEWAFLLVVGVYGTWRDYRIGEDTLWSARQVGKQMHCWHFASNLRVLHLTFRSKQAISNIPHSPGKVWKKINEDAYHSLQSCDSLVTMPSDEPWHKLFRLQSPCWMMWSQLLQTELHAEACPKDESCYLNAGSFYTEQEGTIRNTWIHFKTLLDPITIKWTYKKNRNRASCHFTPHSFLDSHSSWAHLGFTFPASKKRHLEICLLHCGSSRGWGGGVLAAWLFMVSLLPLSTSLVLIPELLPSAACCVNWGAWCLVAKMGWSHLLCFRPATAMLLSTSL